MNELPEYLREYRVKIVLAEDVPPPVEYPDNLGYRTKFGGMPDTIQPLDEDVFICGSCFGKRHFIGQIDSFEHGDPDAEFMFGDVGMIYVWYCFQCCTPHATMDSY